jgi:hypothetical protein
MTEKSMQSMHRKASLPLMSALVLASGDSVMGVTITMVGQTHNCSASAADRPQYLSTACVKVHSF